MMAVLLCSCGFHGKEKNMPTLHVANGAEPPTLDPHLAIDLPGIFILRGLFEGLVVLDDITLEPQAAMAKDWAVSADGLVYSFTLRDDGRWSNGKPLVAKDFVDALRRLLTRSIASPLVDLVFPVKNCRAYYEGKVPWEEVGIRAIDDLHLEIQLEKPTPYFLSLLTHPAWSPISAEDLRSHGAMERRDTPWTRPGNMVSNGPYRLKEWGVGDRIVLEKNSHHYRSDEISVERIVFYPLSSKATAQNAFFNGEIDITASVSEEALDEFRKKYPASLSEVESLHSFYYVINCAHPPLNDSRVRRALALAIDRSILCRLLHFSEKFAAGNLVPDGVGGYYYGGPRLTYDPNEARKLLAEAGYGKEFPHLTLTFNNSETQRLLAQAVQQMWKQELGITITLRGEEWKSFLLTRRHGNYDIGRGGWVGDFNDPQTFLELFQKNAPNNHSRWSHEEYDRQMEKAMEATSPEERYRALQRAESILLQKAPIIPIYFDSNKHLISKRVRGWHPNLLDYHLYQNIQLCHP
ncbi:MAG: peptide ABC transporter substrate-binding protein [Puniceicoccales bacterium]|nr:peptide ABC transporter substrate-binding protein [Puniceicoccales bacterium]